jgi:hypothetical protein
VQGSYLALERTLQSHAALEELAMQGHGLSSPPSIRYRGYLNDFANASIKNFIGGGIDSGQRALQVFMGDNILGDTPFAVIWRNGRLVQLNQNGVPEHTISDAIAATDDTMWYRVYKASDFH